MRKAASQQSPRLLFREDSSGQVMALTFELPDFWPGLLSLNHSLSFSDLLLLSH